MKLAASILLLGLISCARGAGVGTPPRPSASFPGFDKRDFPSLAQMQTWKANSPYQWVGYYLPSPCFSGAAWIGNRQQLVDQGWGLALLYVGMQAPRAVANTATTPTRCSTNTL